jgi:hypothetical protein
MSSEQRYQELVWALCEAASLPDPEQAIQRGSVEVDGFQIFLRYFENDGEAMYMNVDLGKVATIRMIRVYQLMLESNLTLYAQDQAQIGVDPETGAVLLCVRIPMTDEIDGKWMAETCAHYTEHGRYWRDNLSNASDDMFNGLCEGRYMWMRA